MAIIWLKLLSFPLVELKDVLPIIYTENNCPSLINIKFLTLIQILFELLTIHISERWKASRCYMAHRYLTSKQKTK